MTQPFRLGNLYNSSVWPGLMLELKADRIEAMLPTRLHMLSSAVLPGGFSYADRVVNWKVPLDYSGDNPVQDLLAHYAAWGCDPSSTIGFLTAAKLTHASVIETEGDRFRLVCCTTLGTRNAARAGMRRKVYSAYSPGTINTIILIDGAMTEAAMVNAVITATEAKAAALQELGVKEHGTDYTATGTTSDAIAIGASQQACGGAVHAYAGVATTIGCAIAEAVYATVLEAGMTQHED